MRKGLFIALSALLIAACSGKDTYKIKGTIEGVEDGTVLKLSAIDYNSLVDLDSTVVKNGKFTFKGETDTADIALVTFDMDGSLGGCEFYLESGNIEIYINAVDNAQHVGGTPNNEAFQALVDATSLLNDEAQELEDKIRITLATQGDCTDYYRQLDDLQERFKSILTNCIKDNACRAFAYQQLMDNYSLYEPEETMEMLTVLAPYFGYDFSFNQLTAMISSQLNTSLGHPYMDFETSILDKKGGYEGKAKLSDYVGKNKIVLLDFWASWCTPCMNEVPNLKAAYKKFKSKGFEIVSVSVDDEADAWVKAVKDNGMNWVQLWNGTEDMENSAAMQYVVTAIPSTFLIDADGTIIGRNLRGSELEEALEDYFRNK